jgi:hypothetical protein
MVYGFNPLRAECSSGECGNWKQSLPIHFAIGLEQRAAAKCQFRSAFLPTHVGGAWKQGHQPRCIHRARTFYSSREFGAQCSSRFWHNTMGLDVAPAISFPRSRSLKARGDFFNILNHPNFGAPVNYLNSPQFDEAIQTLSNSLGGGGQNGGLSPLYQIGGPRSTQLALKLQF